MRRLLALACAVAVLAGAVPASAAPQPYVHVWQAEGQVGGDLGGASRKEVIVDKMSLTLGGGKFTGHLRFGDILGVQEDSGNVTGQTSSIELTLTGTPLQGGEAAGGTFLGTAKLLTRSIPSLDGLRDMTVDSQGLTTVYEVSGHWGANLAGGLAAGELVYERATPIAKSASGADVKDVTWFNRTSIEPDGGAQAFRVPVSGLAAGAAAGEGTITATGGRQPSVAEAGANERPVYGLSFTEYVARGLASRPGVPAAPVPLVLSRAAGGLKDAAPPGATPLPDNAVAIDVDVTGAYLDAKNRAASLATTGGPAGAPGTALADAWRRVPAVAPAARDAATLAALVSRQRIAGAAELAVDLRDAGATGAVSESDLRTWAAVASAAAAAKPAGSVMSATAREYAAVSSAAIPRSGPRAEAVLVAVQSPRAPAGSRSVFAMRRVPALDASGTVAGESYVNRVLSRAGGATGGGRASLSWDSAGGRVSYAPTRWLAYQRADGSVYWLAGANAVGALTDGTLRGAGFTVERAYLVDSADVGRILAVFDLR